MGDFKCRALRDDWLRITADLMLIGWSGDARRSHWTKLEHMDRKWAERRGEEDMQQRSQGRMSNPGQLRRGLTASVYGVHALSIHYAPHLHL
ncbi:hypothetical protein CHARACLAT_011631 [Characodon lateralis]|uniref:Uncharacterized protein n=1 Tax=Characodon lateralis TaxID=208331 RepID=A0ABU7EIE4_9TELE|nr:hypothetical protein [Characodon lateralis]